MKLINQKGIDLLTKLCNEAAQQYVNITGLTDHSNNIKIGIAKNAIASKKLSFYFRIKKIPFVERHNEITDWYTITIDYSQLENLLPADCFTEERVWRSFNRIFPCREMDQQHLSNTIHYLEILINDGRINESKQQDYLDRLKESVIPELEERFNGEILPYVKRFDWG